MINLIMDDNSEEIHKRLQLPPYVDKTIDEPLFADGEPLLHIAAEYGSLNTVRYAIEQRADINKLNTLGWSAVTTAQYWANEWATRNVLTLLSKCSTVSDWLLENGGEAIGKPDLPSPWLEVRHRPKESHSSRSNQQTKRTRQKGSRSSGSRPQPKKAPAPKDPTHSASWSYDSSESRMG